MAKVSFQVHLENIELSKAQITRMEKEINAVVAKHIVGVVPAEAPVGTKLKVNPEWLGIWLKKFKNPEELKGNLNFKKYKMPVTG
jgi:hypothetical protein